VQEITIMTVGIAHSLTSTASRELAEFCVGLTLDRLPSEVRERAKELTLDLFGVALRGSTDSSSGPVHQVVRTQQASGPASVVGGGFGSSATWAALANGTAAHAIEMDDVTTESSLHPGVAVIPPAFALAEECGLTPSAFLEAVIAGYEVMMRVGNALNPASAYARGFHPTGVVGFFGATTAAGRLLGLDADALTRALGIAGTMASGSLEYLSDGAWTKRLNPGWAGHGGILAAQLAQAGFTGPRSSLDGPLGLLHGYSDEPKPELLLDGLGQSFQIMAVSIKPYACCRYNHGLIDCMLALRRAYAPRPEEVEAITLGVLSGGMRLVGTPIEAKRTPRNVVDAQFSAPFAAAVALARGAAGLAEHSQAIVDDPIVRELMARTTCYNDPALDAPYPRQWPAAAEIRLRDGRTFSTRIEYATGEPQNPVPREGLVAKFNSLATAILSGDQANELAQRLLDLERQELGAIGKVLRGTQ
jgi:2-methylcitrate dehydratase PrpD